MSLVTKRQSHFSGFAFCLYSQQDEHSCIKSPQLAQNLSEVPT